MQTTPLRCDTDTPYASGRGSFPTASHFESGFFSAKTVSYQTFFPPSHGFLSGKFAPPATIRVPLLTPAYIPAKPSGSGNDGSRSHAGFALLESASRVATSAVCMDLPCDSL